jgi:hypothetical protein
MLGQLAGHPAAVDGPLRGVMKDVQPHRSAHELAHDGILSIYDIVDRYLFSTRGAVMSAVTVRYMVDELEVGDLEVAVARLTGTGARIRNQLVEGRGGKQILAEGPSGNPIEPVEPK